MPIDDIRKFVHEACERSENIFSPAFFDQHLAVVADCATRLAARLGADVETVEAAAYLHDISAVLDPAAIPDHPKLSADFTTSFLRERGYPAVRVSAIARSIASHSVPLAMGSAPLEDICVSNADAIARILRPAYWTYFAFGIRKLGFEAGRRWLRSLLEEQWSKLIEPARELAGGQYAATIACLSK